MWGLTVLALAVGTLAIYYPVLGYPFVSYDDPAYVVNNPSLRNGWNWEGVRWAFTSVDYEYNWHPVTWLSHMLDVELFQLDAGWHHGTNLALHLLNGLLLLVALRALGLGFCKSAFVAAAFLWHPVRVESVAWISERKDLLSGTFWMLGLWSYARYCARPDLGRYALVGLCLILGLMSKPMGVTLPCVLLLLDFWPLRRWGGGGPPRAASGPVATRSAPALIAEKLPLFAVVAASCIVTLYTQAEGGAVREQLPLGARLLHVPEAYLHYLAKTFWPVGLSVFYPHPAVADPESMRLVPALVSGGLLGAMSVGLWRLRHSFPELLVGWLWFLGTLVPVIGLIQVGDQAYADRYMYLPGIGLLLTLLAMPGLLRVSSRTVPAAAASLLLLLSIVVAHHQVGFWKDSAALWGRALAVTERNAQAHLGLGNAFANSNRSDEAIAQFEKALEINPGSHAAHTSLGVEFLKRGELEEARAHLERAIEIDPDLASGHFFLSVTLFAMDSVEPARAALKRAKQIDPETNWDRLLLQIRSQR